MTADLREMIARAIFGNQIGSQHWSDPDWAHAKPRAFQHADAALAAIRDAGLVIVPVEPTEASIRAMAESEAVDDEGSLGALTDLIDYSGENKTRSVLKAAYRAMIAAAPPLTPDTAPAGKE